MNEKLEMKIIVECQYCNRRVFVSPYLCDKGWSADCPKCHRPAFISEEIPKSLTPKKKGIYFVSP